MEKKYRAVVIGAGASGLTAAILLARSGIRTAVLEGNDIVGKKLLATGNGKCNLTNEIQTPDCYRGSGAGAAMGLLRRYGVETVLSFFETAGILPKQKNGYWYPNSEQAASVRGALEEELFRSGAAVCTCCRAEEVRTGEHGGGFVVKAVLREEAVMGKAQELIFRADYVVLACGGMAGNVSGADGSGYRLAKGLGLNLVEPVPALVQLRAVEKECKRLSGVRQDAVGELVLSDRERYIERGEFLFTDYGISGIPAMQLSRFASVHLNRRPFFVPDGKKALIGKEAPLPKLFLDFFPDTEENKVFHMLMERFDRFSGRSAKKVLLGLLPAKLNDVLLYRAGISPEYTGGSFSGEGEKLAGGLAGDAAEYIGAGSAVNGTKRNIPENIRKKIMVLAENMKRFPLTISGTKPFEMAQVTAGGVPLDELDPDTLEAKKVKGLYVTGELADVDGTCGGYNLQWAWMSGMAAADSIIGKEGKV